MKTNNGLVDYCQSQMGRPYWYGTFGQISTATLYNYNKSRLPYYYMASDFWDQMGVRVHDCVGLIKGYLWSETPESEPVYCSEPCKIDHSANSMLEACEESGTIDSIPELPGVLVFLPDHVGVYIGSGRVIEARGHRYGVVKTVLSQRPWKHWGKCPYISYEEVDEVKRYERLTDIPNDWGAQDIIRVLMDAQIIKGDGSDPVGNNDLIDLSHDQVRNLVFEYRGGAFDRKFQAMGMQPVVYL